MARFLKILLAAALAYVTPCATGQTPHCALPAAGAQAAAHDYPQWGLITLNDLSVTERKFWMKVTDSTCPGLIEGNFAGVRDGSIAFALLAPDHQREVILLYLFSSGQLLTVVPGAKMKLQVIFIIGPGDFTYDGGPKTQWDSVCIGPVYGCAYMKYRDGKRFIKEDLGD